MNELSELFVNIKNDTKVILENNKIYDVRPENSYVLKGYYCSNSAKQDENPYGLRYSAIFLKNKKNIIIDGNGATIMVHGKMTPLLFYGCENITVKNLKIDYAVPTMTEFTVVDKNSDVITIRINDDCYWRVEDDKLFWHGEKNQNGDFYWENECNAPKRYIKVFDPETKRTRDFSRDNLSFTNIDIIDENTIKCVLKNKDVIINKGEIFQTRNIIRDQVGSMFERCKNLVFENLRVMFMHGLGMVNQYSENITFRNCDFTPKTGRTIASTADFFQFSGCKGDIIIDGCSACGAHDDYINVHGTHLQIVDIDKAANTITVQFKHAETWGFQAFDEGDIIEFIRWDNLQAYDKAEVLSYEKLNNTDIKLKVSFIPDCIIVGKDVVENATYTPDLYVKNCNFGPTSGRGILATTRGRVIIENNRFYKLCGPALLIEDDCNFWFESGYTKEINFCNNEVISCNFGHMGDTTAVIQYSPKIIDEEFAGFVHERLNVYNNKFLKPIADRHVFRLEYLMDAQIRMNKFDAPFEIVKKHCGSISLKDNVNT